MIRRSFLTLLLLLFTLATVSRKLIDAKTWPVETSNR